MTTLEKTSMKKLIHIPLAIPSLNDWQTMHWGARKRLKEEWYEYVWAEVKNAPRIPSGNHCFIAGRMVFRRPNANRDIQNYDAVFWKIIPDAIVNAGIIPNDTEKHMQRGECRFAVNRNLETKGETLVVVAVR